MPVKILRELTPKLRSLTVNGHEYRIGPSPIEGDFCNIYSSETICNGAGTNVCIKVPMDIANNDLLRNEAVVLQRVRHQSLPELIEACTMPDGRMASILKRIDNSYTLYDLRESFPNGLPQEHAVWVMDRLLGVMGHLHSNDVIHGSIEPGNILVTPHNHNALLIDYVLSVSASPGKYLGANDYSAPEVLKGANPHPSSDIYSFGKTMAYLLGGAELDIPSGIDSRIQAFVRSCMKANPAQRRKDAWKAWHELKDLRKDVFGASSQFLELKVGGN